MGPSMIVEVGRLLPRDIIFSQLSVSEISSEITSDLARGECALLAAFCCSILLLHTWFSVGSLGGDVDSSVRMFKELIDSPE